MGVHLFRRDRLYKFLFFWSCLHQVCFQHSRVAPHVGQVGQEGIKSCRFVVPSSRQFSKSRNAQSGRPADDPDVSTAAPALVADPAPKLVRLKLIYLISSLAVCFCARVRFDISAACYRRLKSACLFELLSACLDSACGLGEVLSNIL